VNSRQNNSRDQALQQASLALRMQQFDRAKQLATDILKSNRTDRSAVLILAHALIAQNRQGEAIVPLERAARRGSDAEIETRIAKLRRTAAARGTSTRRVRHYRIRTAVLPQSTPVERISSPRRS
jgi:thioredoxin-like negative regulator of GroEL